MLRPKCIAQYKLQVTMLSRVQLFATPWTVACWAPLSMDFCRQEYWSEVPFLSPGGLPNSGIGLASPASPALVGRFFSIKPLGKPSQKEYIQIICTQIKKFYKWVVHFHTTVRKVSFILAKSFLLIISTDSFSSMELHKSARFSHR